jgi:hypothetical protein
MVKTVGFRSGSALSIFDLVATDMRESFLAPGETRPPPFTAKADHRSTSEPARRRDHRTPCRGAPARCDRLFTHAIGSPMQRLGPLNRILWHDARGWGFRSGVKHSLFFPLAVDLADDEREKVNPVQVAAAHMPA